MSDVRKYTVGWICALPIESVAARVFLDEKHDRPRQIDPRDGNTYALGKMGEHYVVIASLPKGEYGTATAAAVASDLLRSFPNIRVGLMVGIGGGAPRFGHDIRLGDIVVSTPAKGASGVLNYDAGDTIQNQVFQGTKHLDQPPRVLRSAVAELEIKYDMYGHQLNENINQALKGIDKWTKYCRRAANEDRLYHSQHLHPSDPTANCEKTCGSSHLVSRDQRNREVDDPMIHYGLIASADRLIMDACLRDKLASEKGVLCFEMEAAGIMNHFPCLVIRGICDYADTHKNKDWQGFAAMTAAAYAKDLLEEIKPLTIEKEIPIAEAINSIRETVADTKVIVKEMQRNQQGRKIEKWLDPDISAAASNARESRHEGTGLWFLNGGVFQEWIDGRRHHLWLYGLAGCGKTVLITTILDHISTCMGDCTVSSFYFDFNRRGTENVDGMTRSLLYQLCSRHSRAADEVNRICESHGGGKRKADSRTLRECLQTIIRGMGKTIIVLDALDECADRKALLNWFKTFNQPDLRGVRFIATSRLNVEFEEALPLYFGRQNCISLDKIFINADIASYVSAKLEGPEFQRWKSSPDVLEEISRVISAKADGMFRWAACQMESLESCIVRQEIKHALASLPKDLNETYARMLDQIPPMRKRNAIRLLQFLVYAERPVKVQEAVDILAVQIYDHPRSFDKKDRMPKQSDITAYCPGLTSIVRVVKAQTSSIDNTYTEELHLAHMTVKEYLINERVNGLSVSEANLSIGLTCLTYLFSAADHLYEEMIVEVEFPFAELAALTWMDHLNAVQDQDDVPRLVEDYLQGSDNLCTMKRLPLPDDMGYGYDREKTGSGFYYASLGGFIATIRSMISQGVDVNIQGGYLGRPLHAASYKGHRRVVEMLLSEGADPCAEGGQFVTALEAASAGGHVSIVQLLLDRAGGPLRVDHVNFQPTSPLRAAAGQGHKNVVDLLLSRETPGSRAGWEFDYALINAARGGHEDIMWLLLARVNMKRQGNAYQRSLQAATSSGNRSLVRSLLEAAAQAYTDLYADDGILEAACLFGPEDFLKTLIDNGALIDVGEDDYRLSKVLRAAFESQNESKARLVIEHGANIKRRICQGNFYVQNFEVTNEVSAAAVLQIASGQGFRSVVELLLDMGVDVNERTGFFGNALQAASSGGHQEVVQLLLDRGADINLEGGIFGNALQASASGSHVEVAHLLMSRGAALQSVGGSYGHLLHAASYGGVKDIVKGFLNNGAEVNMRAQTGLKYPLIAASAAGHEAIVTLLLSRGADINLQDECGGTAIYNAASKGMVGVVHLLLEEPELDLMIAQEEGRIPLHAATVHGDLVIVRLLLAPGVDKCVRDHRGYTPLHLAWEYAVVQLLLDEGASVLASTFEGQTPLHTFLSFDLSLIKHAWEIVQLLINRGANIEAVDAEGRTPLHFASQHYHYEIAQMLLQKKANIHARDVYGHTSLHLVLMEYLRSDMMSNVMVCLLLDHGADINATDNGGRTPLHIISGASSSRLARLLISKGADVSAKTGAGDTPLHLEIRNPYTDMWKLLLHDPNVILNARNALAQTPLFIAARFGYSQVVVGLLETGRADAAISDWRSSTPLLAAVKNGHSFVVQLLLDYRSELIHHCDNLGLSAVAWARRTYDTEMLSLLQPYANDEMDEADDEIDVLTQPTSFEYGSMWCAACTFTMSMEVSYYHCDICCLGEFNLCSNCYKANIRCLDESHRLQIMYPEGSQPDRCASEADLGPRCHDSPHEAWSTEIPNASRRLAQQHYNEG